MICSNYSIQWQSSMRELVPEIMDTTTYITHVALEIFRYIPCLIVESLYNWLMRPLFADFHSGFQEIVRNSLQDLPFKIEFMNISLPDGRSVKATFYKDTRGDESTPTILRFPGLGETQGSFRYLGLISEHPINFVTFDYPGVGENSEWNPSKQHAILATLSIYANLTQNLHIPSEKLHFWGMSLGGAMAIETKRLLPEHQGQLFCDRTFGNLQEALKGIFGPCFGTLLYICFWLLGQDFPSSQTLASLPQGKVHVFNLAENYDAVIPSYADLFTHRVNNPALDLHYLSLLPNSNTTGENDYHVTPVNALHIADASHTPVTKYICQQIGYTK